MNLKIVSSVFAFIVVTSCSTISVGLPEENRYLSYEEKSQIYSLFDFGQEWLDSLCSTTMMGRRAGTKGNSLAYSYLCSELIYMGYQPVTDSFATEKGTLIRNIVVKIPGDNDSTIIIGAHFDGAIESYNGIHYCAAEDNGSGVVTLLMLLKRFRDDSSPFGKTIQCCFWDSEETFEGRAFRGSAHYVGNLPIDQLRLTLLYINLDTIGHDHEGKNEIYFDYFGEDRTSRAVETLSKNNRFHYIVSKRSSNLVSDYASFYQKGIPFISFHDHSGFTCEHPNHSIADTPDAIAINRLVTITQNVIDAIVAY